VRNIILINSKEFEPIVYDCQRAIITLDKKWEVGQTVTLRDFDSDGVTGREIDIRISWINRFRVKPGEVMLSFDKKYHRMEMKNRG